MIREVLSHEHPIAMAHRGSRLLWPENTMVAFQGAVDLGYRYLETDLHATSDGVLVLFHDDTLGRTTDGSGNIKKRTFEDLSQLDAGYRFDPIHHFPHRGAGLRIPTLEELAQTFPTAMLTLDLKQSGIEKLLADAVHRLNLWDRVIVGSFSDTRIRKFRKLTGRRVATSSGPRETLRAMASARRGRPVSVPADALQVPEIYGRIQVVTPKLVRAAHDGGKQVHVWTVNDADDMKRLLAMGVDGIITDRPDTLKDVLGPAQTPREDAVDE